MRVVEKRRLWLGPVHQVATKAHLIRSVVPLWGCTLGFHPGFQGGGSRIRLNLVDLDDCSSDLQIKRRNRFLTHDRSHGVYVADARGPRRLESSLKFEYRGELFRGCQILFRIPRIVTEGNRRRCERPTLTASSFLTSLHQLILLFHHLLKLSRGTRR